MANINILDKTIFNRIAAGEVVEKPASVVKELVENSIDAGATYITIDIDNGGIDRIKVSDNGHGMNKENISKCILPHATSKISNIDDLEKIGTLGFRGEALSSICSCAKVSITSKTEDQEIGYTLCCNGGECLDIVETGTVTGTTVNVEELFYCVPARAKFLRKPKQEETEITNIVSRLILANPNVSIKYTANNKLIFNSTGGGLKDAIYCVYNKDTVDNLIPISFSNELVKVNGYISKPNFSKPNRTYQTLVINNRYVINYSISSAIQKAYEHFLMKGNFPFYVIHMDLPLNKVDVNVHPTKLEVKFEDGGRIYVMFLNEVSNKLFDVETLKEVTSVTNTFKAPKDAITEDYSKLINEVKEELKQNTLSEENKSDNNTSNTEKETLTEASQIKEETIVCENNNLNTFENKFAKEEKVLENLLSTPVNVNNLQFNSDNGFGADLVETMVKNSPNLKEKYEAHETQQQTFNIVDNFKIVGTVFGTFIIVEQNNNLIIIDQHAGHERIMFDKFMKEFENKQIAIQPLLVPYILDTNYQESSFILENIQNFADLGFQIEEFGTNCFKISTVPLLLKDISFNAFFSDVLKDLNNGFNFSKKDMVYNLIARKACRSAIKANDFLSDMEIKTLINLINNTSILRCPHGRPIAINLSKLELEKMFKRIV